MEDLGKVFLTVNNLASFVSLVFRPVIAAPQVRPKICRIFIGSSYDHTNFLSKLQHHKSAPINSQRYCDICKQYLQSFFNPQQSYGAIFIAKSWNVLFLVLFWLHLAGMALLFIVIRGLNVSFIFCITVFLFRNFHLVLWFTIGSYFVIHIFGFFIANLVVKLVRRCCFYHDESPLTCNDLGGAYA